MLAFVFGWYCNTKAFEYISAKVDFDEAAKRLMEVDDERKRNNS